MQKEVKSGLFNSRDAKVNLLLLVAMALFFILSMLIVHAITITTGAPGAYTFNATTSRNINFSFTPIWSETTENGTYLNCSLYINSTIPTIRIDTAVKNVSTASVGDDNRITNNSLSYMNFTFSMDGNYTYSIACWNNSNSTNGVTPGLFFSSNVSFYLDTTVPRVVGVTPNASFAQIAGAGNRQYLSGNFTGFPITFRVNVTDNTTVNMWYILNSTVSSLGSDDLENVSSSSGPTRNVTMTNEFAVSANDIYVSGTMRGYAVNVSLNFSSRWRGPGPHSVVFCANDSAGNRKCSGSYDFVVMGVNVSDIERIFGEGTSNPDAGFAFRGMDIRYGNGTDVPSDSFMNPTVENFTFNLNFSSDRGIHIVGAKIDERQLGNATKTNFTDQVTVQARREASTGFKSNLTWTDVRSFMPTDISYQFGIMRTDTFSKMMFCNGTTIDSPNCFIISPCNATTFDIFNQSSVVPPASACWLKGGTGSWGVNESNGTHFLSGFSYMLVDHFSGGLGANDFGSPNVTLNTFTVNVTHNLSDATTRLINFTLEDVNSTGMNLSKNESINVTIKLGGSVVAFFNFTNGTDSGTRVTCDSNDDNFPQNSTSVACNVTYRFASNGTYLVNITGIDTSNNTNVMNTTGNFFFVTVDGIAPVVFNLTLTNGSAVGLASGVEMIGASSPDTAQVTGDGTWAQGRTIRFFANVSDNLTQPIDVDLQLFNESSGSWQTINTTSKTNVTGNRHNLTEQPNNLTRNITDVHYVLNLTYTPYVGRGIFEGHNVTFRILVNDTLGNRNTNGSNGSGFLRNITVQVNDTVKPTLQVTIGNSTNLNYSNTSSATPTVVWNISESNDIKYIAVQVDSETSSSCNLYTNFTTISDTRGNRNGTITVKGKEDNAVCTGLANGTHTVRLTSEDVWGNSELYIHSFQVQSGMPGLVFNNITTRASGAGVTSNKALVNNTNITSVFGVGFYGLGGTVNIHNLTYVSSCNSTSTVVFSNSTVVYPFNESTCPTSAGNRTLTITVTDENGRSNSTVFGFVVDNIGPNITLNSPLNTAQIVNIGNISVTAFDNESGISSIGYYLDSYEDRSDTRFNNTGSTATVNYYPTNANAIEFVGGKGVTFIFNTTINFTPGTHTIKISINDTLGNVKNSSLITFTKTGPFDFSTVNYSMDIYSNDTLGERLQNVRMRVKTGAGYEDIATTNETSGLTVEILFNMNGSINASLTEINTSAVNWDKINFTPFINITSTTFAVNGVQNVTQKLQLNWTNTVSQAVIFNNSLLDFASNNNSYFGVVVFPKNASVNSSTANKTTIQEFWWLTDPGNVGSRTNITKCTEGFSSASTTPCWNYTSGGRTIVQVPYFGIVVAVNDTDAPTVNVTIPSTANQSTGMFVPNITVSSDAVSCLSSVNSSVPNVTMTKSGNICLGQTERFKNLNAVHGNYNFTFTVTDAVGNINRYVWKFNVTDTLAPNMGSISSGVDRTSATVTISNVNESVNATVLLGTSNGSLTSIAVETDFNTTQVVTISGLTASTTYYYNVTVCDFNGNCIGNGTHSFTTTAAAAAASTTTSSSSGGGGGGAAPVSNTEASTAAAWDTLAAGSAGTLTSKDAKIAITGITFNVKNALSNPSLSLESLKSNPLSSAAAGKVYQYLQILNKNMADLDISGITITFKVPRAWLTANGVAEGDVALYRYNSGKWNQLPTTMTGSDAEYVTYSASSPGFSTYAVGNKEAAPAVTPAQPTAPTEPAQPTAPTEPTGAVTTQAAPTEPTPTEPTEKGLSKTAMAWVVVLIIAIVGALGYFLYQKKKGA